MSLLTIVQQVALKTLKTNPSQITTAVGSADTNVLDMVAFVNEDGQELQTRASWQNLRREALWSSVGVQNSVNTFGALTGGAGYAAGFSGVFNNVPLTGGTGVGAQASITVTAGIVTACNLALYTNTAAGAGNGAGGGQNYTAGDVLSASNANLGGSGAGFSIVVKTVALVGVQNQGALTTRAGADFGFVVNETFWDRTTRRPVFGPKTPAEWQQLLAQQMQGPWVQYTVRAGNVLMLPPPAVGDQMVFEWCSVNWCTNAAGTTGQTAMVADTDVTLLDEPLHILGASWRFKQANRLAYQEDQDKYEDRFASLFSRDGVKARLSLAGAQNDIYPGILVPAGNWPVP